MPSDRHELAKLPEIQTTDSEPGLLAANLVRIQVCYPCQCALLDAYDARQEDGGRDA